MSDIGKASPWKHLAFFTAGFVFDAFMVRRIDEPKVLIQQGLYLALSGVLLAGLVGRFHHKRMADRRQVVRHAVVPALGVQALLLVLYVFRLIPPVPLSLMEIGIYHDVARQNDGAYRVSYVKPPWYRFWASDDTD